MENYGVLEIWRQVREKKINKSEILTRKIHETLYLLQAVNEKLKNSDCCSLNLLM